jgi:hypothetical protein
MRQSPLHEGLPNIYKINGFTSRTEIEEAREFVPYNQREVVDACHEVISATYRESVLIRA